MRDLTGGLLAVAMLGFAGCTSSPPAESHDTADIVNDPFPEAQAAIRAEMLALGDIGRRHDWDGLRAAHMEGLKFSEIGAGLERNDFEEMITGEIARVSAVQNLSIDWRELKIDVFGDAAVATSFPLHFPVGPSFLVSEESEYSEYSDYSGHLYGHLGDVDSALE